MRQGGFKTSPGGRERGRPVGRGGRSASGTRTEHPMGLFADRTRKRVLKRARAGRGDAASRARATDAYFTEYFVNAPPACTSEFGPSAAKTLPSASTAIPSPAVPW